MCLSTLSLDHHHSDHRKWVPIDPPLYAETGNILLSRLMGGDVRLNSETFDIGHKAATEAAFKSVEAAGGKP